MKISKRILISFLLMACCMICNAQITPPKQIDTLIITSLRYNEVDIEREDWPFKEIYKSKTDFRIGDSRYNIVEVNKWRKTSHYSIIEAGKGMPLDLWMTTGNLNKFTLVLFNGYELSCISNKYIPVERYYSQPCVTRHTLDGREVTDLNFPDFLCHGEGEIVILVQVDREGKVTGSRVIDDQSENNKCLRYFALRSASMSRFTPSDEAPELQYGEIVYKFKRDKSSKSMRNFDALLEKHPWLP